MFYEQRQDRMKDKTIPTKHDLLDREHERVNQELIRLALRGERNSLRVSEEA